MSAETLVLARFKAHGHFGGTVLLRKDWPVRSIVNRWIDLGLVEWVCGKQPTEDILILTGNEPEKEGE